MAHKLNIIKGEASFFTVREKAWHGLGKVVQDAPNSEEAIKLAGLNYTVEKAPVYSLRGDTYAPIAGSYETYRTDNGVTLGTVKGRYQILQNLHAFDFFDSIVGKGEAIYETAGALGAGEKIFITAKLPDYIKVGKDDLIEQYLFLTNTHDGSGVIQAAFTPVRIVCNNTLRAALKQNSNMVRIMHTGDVHGKVKAAHQIMGMANMMKAELEPIFNVMAKKPLVDSKLKNLILHTFAGKNQLDILARGPKTAGENASMTKLQNLVTDAYTYAMVSDTQQMATTKGTVFGAYNAITGYLQNVKDIKNEESNLISILEGSGQDYTQKAFNLSLELIK